MNLFCVPKVMKGSFWSHRKVYQKKLSSIGELFFRIVVVIGSIFGFNSEFS